jgi:glycosyltransferase involved in cell wall biosynthesis
MEENKQFLFDFCLLIPYYNNLPGLIRSLESVSYDLAKFKVLIIDDGSIDILHRRHLTPPIPAAMSVEIVRLPENKGITEALNTGLGWLEMHKDFRFVARLDCGDICTTERFSSQIGFLEAHPEVDMVGSWCIFKNFSTGWAFRYRTPTRHEEIVRGMHFRNVFRHSTVTWRAELPAKAGIYPYTFPHAEDYGFFYQILNKGKAAIIPNDLVICEINPDSISVQHRREQLKSRISVVRQYGKNRLYRLIGVLKLRLLLAVPYKIILQIKRFIYGIKRNSVI